MVYSVWCMKGDGKRGWGCSAGAAVNRLHRKPYQQKEESRERRDERQEKNKETEKRENKNDSFFFPLFKAKSDK